jgi:hypothetical protein
MVSRTVLTTAGLALALAACNRAGPSPSPAAPSAAPGVTPSTFAMPQGSGCAADIARFRAVIANDRETGHIGRSVADRALAEAERAASACAAGRAGEAERMLAGTKSRFGYP